MTQRRTAPLHVSRQKRAATSCPGNRREARALPRPAAAGRICVSVVANDDPVRYGCDLLDASIDPDAARGFPVCEARVDLDGAGYRAACGWVQLVCSTDAGDTFDIDPLTVYRDVATP